MARTTRQNRATPKSPLNDYPREDLKTSKDPVASPLEMGHPALNQREESEDDKTVPKEKRRADKNAQATAVKKRRTDQEEQRQHDTKRAIIKNTNSTTDQKRQTLQSSAPVKQPSRLAALEDPDADKHPKMSNKAKTPARQVTREANSGAREQPIIPEDREFHFARDYPNLRPSVAADILQVWRNTLSITGSSQKLTGFTNTEVAEQAAPKLAKSKRARDLPRASQAMAQGQPAQQEPVVPQTPETPQPYHTSYGGNSDRERDQRIISLMNNTRQAENETKKAAEPREKPLPLEGANKVDDGDDSAAPKAKPKKRSAIPTLGRRNQVIVASRKRDTDKLIEGEDYVVTPGRTTYYFNPDQFADEETSRSDDTSSIEPTEDYHYIWVWRWGERKRKRVPNKRPTEAGAPAGAPVGRGAAAPKKSGPRMSAARAAKDSKDGKTTKRAEEVSGAPHCVYSGPTGPGVMRAYVENKKRLEHARTAGATIQDGDMEKQDDV